MTMPKSFNTYSEEQHERYLRTCKIGFPHGCGTMSYVPPLSEHGSIDGFRNTMFNLKMDDEQSPKNNTILVNEVML